MQQITTVEGSDCKKFDEQVNELLRQGYKILSTSCGYANSEQYDFCPVLHAILVIETVQNKEVQESKQYLGPSELADLILSNMDKEPSS